MYFTHWTPGQILPNYAETEGISLQVYSFKITKIKGNLRWPLQVYGAVAARDNSDRKRNIIFNRLRHDCQEIFSDVCARFHILFFSLFVLFRFLTVAYVFVGRPICFVAIRNE